MTVTDAAQGLADAAHHRAWSFAVAFGVVLVVMGIRAFPNSAWLRWTRTDLGGIVVVLLTSLAGAVTPALIAHRAPWDPAVVLDALNVAAKAIAAYVTARKTGVLKGGKYDPPPPTATAPVTGEITVKPVLVPPPLPEAP